MSPTVGDPYNVREHKNMASRTAPDAYRKSHKNQKHF